MHLPGIIGQLDDRDAIDAPHLQDHMNGLASCEVIGEVGSDTEAQPDPAFEIPLDRESLFDIQAVTEHDGFCIGSDANGFIMTNDAVSESEGIATVVPDSVQGLS